MARRKKFANAMKALGLNVAKAAAPRGFTFKGSRRIVHSRTTRKSMPWWLHILLSALPAVGWAFSWWWEKRLRRAAALASGTSSTRLVDLFRALRGPGASLPGRPSSATAANDVEEEPVLGLPAYPVNLSITVRAMSGQRILGPVIMESITLVEEIKHKVAEVLGEPAFAVRIVQDNVELDSTLSLTVAGVQNAAELTAVISRDRVGIADALYARVAGEIWVPDNQRAVAPFSNRRVVYCEATVTRLYDEWVTRTERRCIKAGRKATDKDDGSDSEYEEVDSSGWESREMVQNRQSHIAPHIYIDDGSTQRAVIAPPNINQWARSNATLTFQDRQAHHLGIGAGLMAMVSTERERGVRREELCISKGEAVEIVAEARRTVDGLVLQEPSVPAEALHRVDSESLIRASHLQGKSFEGAVLRGHRDLLSMKLSIAWWHRLGKWLFGVVTLLMTISLVRRARRQRSHLKLLA